MKIGIIGSGAIGGILGKLWAQAGHEVLFSIGSLEGKILIDTMNPLKVNESFEHSHDLDFMQSSSTLEELQRRVPNAKVVKAFSTIPAHLLDKDAWKDSEIPSVFFAGTDKQRNKL